MYGEGEQYDTGEGGHKREKVKEQGEEYERIPEGERERETERHRKRTRGEREMERDRQTDRPTEGQTARQAGRQRETDMGKHPLAGWCNLTSMLHWGKKQQTAPVLCAL